MFFSGQIKISEKIKVSKIATQDEYPLYFIDFWATWCVPCIHVSKYLETLQAEYPNDIYVLSLSQENPDIVKRFLKKHKIDLAVAIDYNGENFQKNNIYSLPYGVLLNASGKKLWEGHPAEFKAFHIRHFLNKNKKKIAVNNMFKAQFYSKAKTFKSDKVDSDFEYSKIANQIDGIQIVKNNDNIELKGTLQDILAYSLNAYKDQIVVPASINESYKMRFKFETDAFFNMPKTILKALKLKQNDTQRKGEALVFVIKNPTFWDTKQIDWGTDSQPFIIGDSDIMGDNVTLGQVTYQLAKLIEMPIVINGNDLADKPHDWQIHYKYFDLMTSSFSDNYGIQIEKKIVSYPQYTITKRAP